MGKFFLFFLAEYEGFHNFKTGIFVGLGLRFGDGILKFDRGDFF
jgi:hypothetical protein